MKNVQTQEVDILLLPAAFQLGFQFFNSGQVTFKFLWEHMSQFIGRNPDGFLSVTKRIIRR